MKSPFPGMDPYLEARWQDIHSRLAFLATEQLRPQLPKALRARIEEDFVIEADSEDRPRRVVPDAAVTERLPPQADPALETSASPVADPLVVTWDVEPMIQRSVHILDTEHGHRLVTAIELISPTNKSDARNRRMYRRKQRNILDGGASLVEVDLIRSGGYVLHVPAAAVPVEHIAPYRVCVTRGWDVGRAELYPLRLRVKLPAIRIPLRETDRDAVLDLQALIDAAYESGAYDDIDYTLDPDPPLTGEDAAWADDFLRQQGKR